MPDNTFRHYSPGEPFVPHAELFNALADVAADYRRRALAGDEPDLGNPLGQARIKVKNVSGSAVGRFGVLSLTGQAPVIPVATRLEGFQQQPAMEGASPAGGGETFVILDEPIPNGKIGNAVIAGAMQVQVNVTDAAHAFAETEAAHADRLKSRADGQNAARILWKESGTGTGKWALVLLPVLREAAGTTFSGARAYRSATTQTVSSGDVTYTNSLYDTDGYVTAGGLMTIPLTGKYHVGASINNITPSTVGDDATFRLTLNGTTNVIASSDKINMTGPKIYSVDLSTDYQFTGGDTVRVNILYGGAGSVNLNGDGYTPAMWIHKLS